MIAIIDNSPIGPYRDSIQRFIRKMRDITDERVRALSFGNLESKESLRVLREAKALILGGFGDWVPIEHWHIPYFKEFELVRETEIPILGICGGHQLISLALGGSVEPLGRVVKGYRTVRVLERDPLFNHLGDDILVFESHQDHVTKLPKRFKLLASSSDTLVETMRADKRLIYGVQFHPESYDESHQDGRKVLENFWIMVKK